MSVRTICRNCGQEQSARGYEGHESDRAYTVREGCCRSCAAAKRVKTRRSTTPQEAR